MIVGQTIVIDGGVSLLGHHRPLASDHVLGHRSRSRVIAGSPPSTTAVMRGGRPRRWRPSDASSPAAPPAASSRSAAAPAPTSTTTTGRASNPSTPPSPTPSCSTAPASASTPCRADVRATGSPQRGPRRSPPLRRRHLRLRRRTLVLCTVADLARSLAEVHRVLKPGGQLRLFEHVAAAARCEPSSASSSPSTAGPRPAASYRETPKPPCARPASPSRSSNDSRWVRCGRRSSESPRRPKAHQVPVEAQLPVTIPRLPRPRAGEGLGGGSDATHKKTGRRGCRPVSILVQRVIPRFVV